MKYKDFIKECGDKQVFKKLSIYIVTSWVIIQVLAVLYEPLGISKKSISISILILLIGFPVYIYYIWKTSLIHLELEGEELINKRGQPINFKLATRAFRKMFFITLSVIILMVIFSSSIIIKNTFLIYDTTSTNTIKIIDKIAVLKFGNNTGDEKLDIIGKMAADWIIHGIRENNVAQVISPELIDDYSSTIKKSLSPTDENIILNDYLKPEKIIVGNYYLKNKKLLFQGSIIENIDGTTKTTSFKIIECNSDNPIDCIESLKQVILGYLITKENEELNLQEAPPLFKAYQYVLESKANFDNPEKHLEFLDKAIEIDPNYFEPKVLKVAHYYNMDQFKIADSIMRGITISSRANSRQKILLHFYEALLNGNNKKVYEYLLKEYRMTPFDIGTNSSMLVVTLQYVNLPNEIDEIFDQLSFNDVEIEDCIQCAYRVYMKARAAIELKNYDDAIAILPKAIDLSDYLELKKTLMSVYVRTNQQVKIEAFLSKYSIDLSQEEIVDLYFFIGKEFLLVDDSTMAIRYFDTIINNEYATELMKAKAMYYKGDYKNAESKYVSFYQNDSTSIDVLTKLAIIKMKLGKSESSNTFFQKIEEQRDDFQYGAIDYAFAHYYSSINDTKNTFIYLKKAVSAGLRYEDDTFQNDPHFVKINNSKEFYEIMNFWNH